MSSRNPTAWMWAQACELLDQAERMHRQFFRLAASGRTQALWEPPVDVFEDEHEIIVVVALPGVAFERVEITYESGMLVVRANRRIPFAGSPRAVRRLEIPYGLFERRIPLPEGRLDAGTSEYADGCLILRLRKTGQS
jgi:HSP20 family molecular chaperone IbpA